MTICYLKQIRHLSNLSTNTANLTNLFCNLLSAQEAHSSEAYLELSQTSNKELFPKIANRSKPFTKFGKNSILDVRLSSEYTSVSIREVNILSYREVLSLKIIRIRENTDQKKLRILHFSHSERN